MAYERRIIDDELDELLAGLAAVAIEGPKAVGKTATALERAATVIRLDDPAQATLVEADPGRLTASDTPVLLDEWQRAPGVWDVVKRSVDEDPSPNRFILTGSVATAGGAPTHSGAGRIVRVRMRPLSLAERLVDTPTVSLGHLLGGGRPPIDGSTTVSLRRYTEEIVRSGFPALRTLRGRPLRAQLDSYVARIVDRDFEEAGQPVRRPETLRRWMTAYAAATGTMASLETIRDAATFGEREKPSRPTVLSYRDVLTRLWVLDPVPAWLPTNNYFSALSHPEKHHLADPALAASLLGLDVNALLQGEDADVPMPRDGTLLGLLFESLVTQSVRVYAQAAEAKVMHLRTKAGRNEVDLIVERPDHRVLAIEVKLGRTIDDADVKQLHWLRSRVGRDLLDAVVVHTGPYAYRRADGIAVVPAALLGP